MAVDIIHDTTGEIACLYDTTTDWAFGPTFTGPSAGDDADAFLEWLRRNGPIEGCQIDPVYGDAGVFVHGTDPRDYTAEGLTNAKAAWQRSNDVREPDGQRLEGGRWVPTER